ncbi:class I SAM-dependent methyltransferase [Adhaeribacter rhizoryzae]|uniref:Class I SAM-dependent methyltransferase n=2 Tax=Adhaeribacter rhizoryzae TaxID=2607907 RepID=A0A5M6DBE8_9BACT|nr:class I SAM-dependent methyltransferase [Adhaeribacter rhizoryzae]
MKPGADIIGHALQDYLAGEQAATIQVYSDIADPEELIAAYFFRSAAQMPELEKIALRHCRGKIADLGAGAGSHSLELQNNGFNVTAFDISKGACAVMRKRGVNNVVQADVFSLGAEQFDTILMLMNGIGLVNSPDGLVYFLERLKNNLAPGGQVILDSSDITYMYYDEEGALNLDLNAEYHGVVTYQMEYKNKKGQPFKWLFIEFPVLQEYCEQTGYTCELLAQGENDQYLAKLTLQD